MKEQIKEIISEQWGSLMGIGVAADQITQLIAEKCIDAIMMQVKVGDSITESLQALGFDEATAYGALKTRANKNEINKTQP